MNKVTLVATFLFLTVHSVEARAEWESLLFPREYSFEPSLSKALQTARQTSKHVIVYYTRTNCPPCNVLQGMLNEAEIKALYGQSYIFSAVWGNAMSFAQRDSYRLNFDVQGAPTWLVYRNTGEYLCTSRGGFGSPAAGKKLFSALEALLREPAGSANTGPNACPSAA